MRADRGLGLVLLLVAMPASALRLSPSVTTERPVNEVGIRIYRAGLDGAAGATPLTEVKGEPRSLLVDVPDDAFPLRLEVTAAGHLGAAMTLVTPPLADLPALWLPAGRTVEVRVQALGRPVAGAQVAGELEDPNLVTRMPGQWVAAVPTLLSDAAGKVKLVLPEGGWAELWARAADGRWGRLRVEERRAAEAVLRLDSRALRVVARKPDGQPLAGVRVAAAAAPPGSAATTGADGGATVQVPGEGQVVLHALGDGCSARTLLLVTPKAPVQLVCAALPTVAARITGAPRVWLWPSWVAQALWEGWRAYPGGRVEIPALDTSGFLDVWAPGVCPVSVTLAPGSRVSAVALGPGASIDGRVVGIRDMPVRGVPVWEAHLPRWARLGGPRGAVPELLRKPLLPAAVSGQNGSFVLSGLASGARRLEARYAGFPPASSAVLELGAGSEKAVILRLDPGTTLTALITDPEARPLRGVTLEVVQRSESRGRVVMRLGRSRAESPVASGVTDQEGRVQVRAVPVGPAALSLAAPGYVRRTLEVEVPRHGLDAGTIVLEPGAVISGRVVDETGAAVSGAVVRALPMQGRGLAQGETSSDAQGVFALPDQPQSGQVFLSAEAEGYVGGEPTRISLPPAGPVEVVLRRGRVLEGRVVDEASTMPVTGAAVTLARTRERGMGGGGMAVRMVTSQAQSVETDGEGRFRVEDLTPGDYDLAVKAKGYREGSQGVTVPEAGRPSSVTVLLQTGLSLHGRVLASDGAPSAGVLVEAAPAGEMVRLHAERVASDEDGRFQLEGLEPGRVAVTAVADDGATAREVVEAGREEDVVLHLSPAGVLEGRVVTQTGETPTGVQVAAFGVGAGGASLQPTVQPDGSFVAERVTPGQYRVSADAPGWSRASAEVTVVSGQPASVELVLKRGGSIVGQVLGLTASELERCQVLAESARAKPAADGSFTLTGVRPGEGEVLGMVFPDGKRRSARYSLQDLETPVRVELDFGRGVTVSGTVRRGGQPTPGLTVDARSTGAGGSSVTDAGGSFEVPGLEPGEVTVRVLDARGRSLVVKTLAVDADRRLDLDVPGGVVRGRVVALPERRPVVGARVSVRGEGEAAGLERGAVCDETGAFRVEELPDGDFTVEARAASFTPASRAVHVTMGAAPEVTLELEAERRLVLEVRLSGGAVPDQINVLPARGGQVGAAAWVQVDRTGEAVVETLPAGSFTLLVSAGGEAALFQAVVPGGPVPVPLGPTGTLRVLPAASARVRVVAVEQALVVPIGPWQNPERGDWVDVAEGLVVTLPAGTFQVQVQRGGQLVEPVLVTVGPGQPVFVTLPDAAA